MSESKAVSELRQMYEDNIYNAEIIQKCAAVCEEMANQLLTGDGNTLVRTDRFLAAGDCKKAILSVLETDDDDDND